MSGYYPTGNCLFLLIELHTLYTFIFLKISSIEGKFQNATI